ncbi:hypothetical protein RRF57_013024 [Xylaria bambusicola]|uniref:Tyrosinase copper-binding domain-containing protein n=1 Tax=Xylaria bambusicola TaxID=326684 RepID=A0AAN7ZB82_9PEZI
MRISANFVSLLLAFGSSTVLASPVARRACAVKTQRKAWEDLTDAEKKAYLDADLCLFNTPPITKIPGAKNVWDELQWTHAAQAGYIHFVGTFLPFHRYYVRAHETLIRDLCGYDGPLPYWNEPGDVGALNKASILDPKTGFGSGGNGTAQCLTDGPFANVTLRIGWDLKAGKEYCVYRAINGRFFNNAAQKNVDKCLAMATFNDAWRCIEGAPHSAGHGGINGLMIDVALSPGDPIFWLHHGWIDKLWWDWESRKLPARLTEVPNATVADVMDLGGEYVCAEFV